MAKSIPLYVDNGTAIVTHSMIKTMRRCHKQAEYKYVQRLKPRIASLPLERGTWMHALFETHYMGEDWEVAHKELSRRFGELFDEERDELGDLPRECETLMRSYLWHYKGEKWKVHETEMTLETPFPDGTLYRGKIDLLIENEWGLWIVDHKTHKSLPNIDFRLLDAQSALYLWAADRMGIKVQGFIWNYVKTKPPSVPALLKSGNRLSRAKCDTDYRTLKKAIKDYGLDPDDYRVWLDRLKAQRYQHGQPQLSPFFRRDILEKTPQLLERVAAEAYHTAQRMHRYPWDKPEKVERSPDRSCAYMCSYKDLCIMELLGGNTSGIRKQRYKVGDPMDYYQDEKLHLTEKGGDF